MTPENTQPPAPEEFGPFRIPDGRVWTPGNPAWDTRDGGCVAVAEGPDGWIAVADTKRHDSPILVFTADEWTAHRAAVVAGQH